MKLSDLLLHAPKGLWGEELKNGESGVPVIKTNNLTYEGHINFTDLTYRSIDNHDAVPNYLQKGDLLVEKSGGTKTHSVGYINYFDGENQKYVANNFILVLRPNEQLVSSKYLFYQMKYKYESGQIRNCYEQTTGIQNLRVKSYLQKEVLCPSRTIQNDVALSLDSITSAILIEKASLLSADELIKSRFNEMFSTADGEICRLGDVAEIKSGKTIPLEKENEGGPILYAKVLDMNLIGNEKYMRLSTKYVKRETAGNILFPNGSVIFPKNGAAIATNKKRICVSDTTVDLNTMGLIPNFNVLKSEYLYVWMLNFDLMSIATGSALPTINKTNLSNVKIQVPKLSLQNEFSVFVKQVDKLKFAGVSWGVAVFEVGHRKQVDIRLSSVGIFPEYPRLTPENPTVETIDKEKSARE